MILSTILALCLPVQGVPQDASAVRDLIDRHFEARWKESGRTPGAPADGYAFCRRVSLDVTGRLPEPDWIRKERGHRHQTMVDNALASPRAAEYFADLWIQWLNGYEISIQDQIRCDFGALHAWIAEAWTKDMPYDAFIRALLSDRGHRTEKPAVNFGLKHLPRGEPPVALAYQSAKLFLGRDIRCAQCHDHPYEAMTREEFWGFAGFFRPIVGRGESLEEIEGRHFDGAIADHLGEMRVEPRFLDGRKPAPGRRLGQELADFTVTSAGHPHARALVERLWRLYFGRPLGRDHASLTDALVKEFVAGGQSPKKLIRGILLSKPYRLSSEGKDEDRRAYAAGPLKYMNAVQFMRAFARVFGLEKHYVKLYEKARADGQTAPAFRDPQNLWLGFFRWAREMILPKGRDPDEVIASGTVRLSLKLMNNRDLQLLILAQFGFVRVVMLHNQVSEKRVEELFMTTLSRPPSKEELERFVHSAKGAANPYHAMEDVFWALVNSGEFIFVR